MPGETLNSATTQRQQLLRPFPQFGQHRRAALRRLERVRLGAVPAREAVQRRVHGSHELHVVGVQGKGHGLNDTDADYEERFHDTHLPHRLVLNGIWELPFGRGRRFGRDANALVQRLHRQLERVGDLELAERAART